MNRDKLLKTHRFNFDRAINGGEGLTLETLMFDNGDGYPNGFYYNQTLTLQSYSNSAQFNLYGCALTPKKLRKLADELERAELEIEMNMKEPNSNYESI